MENKHTQGEWKAFKRNIIESNLSFVIQSTNGDTVCVIRRDDSDDSFTELANAKLIAAAPELLEALKDVVSQLKSHNNLGNVLGMDFESITKAELSIKKATE